MNAKRLQRLSSLLLGLLLAGCISSNPFVAPPTRTPPPTETPTPTATARIILATRLTDVPKVTVKVPTSSPRPPTATPTSLATATAPAPTNTSSPTPVPISQAFIQIFQPAGGSTVVSPIKVSGESNSTFEQNLVVAVYDSTGKQLALKPATIQAELGKRGPFSIEIPFTVTREQPGRISVYETSAANGGILHLNSVEVTLRPPGGKTDLLPAKPAPDLIRITKPEPNAQVSGGGLQVEGYGGLIFENQFSIALCGPGGTSKPEPICGTVDNVIARGSGLIKAPQPGQSGPFSAYLVYTVRQRTPAWVVVYDNSPRDGGLVFVNSQPIQLLP